MVGKYTTQADTYTSIVKALGYAGIEANRKVVIKVNFLKIYSNFFVVVNSLNFSIVHRFV